MCFDNLIQKVEGSSLCVVAFIEIIPLLNQISGCACPIGQEVVPPTPYLCLLDAIKSTGAHPTTSTAMVLFELLRTAATFCDKYLIDIQNRKFLYLPRNI